MKFAAAFSALILGTLSSVVSAAPSGNAARAALDVWDPTMTYPTNGTLWEWGNTYTVTWETADQPKSITNPSGSIILVSHGIETEVLLAWDFDIRSGQVDVTVPAVITDDQYALVLFGDSGNIGPTFTIYGPQGY